MPRENPSSATAATDGQCLATGDLAQRNDELEKFNQALLAERERLRQMLADSQCMLAAAISGLFMLDKSGLITAVNPRAAEMLAAESAYLLKKPFAMFIAPEDQAVFYINRSRIVGGASGAPFEIKLKSRDGAVWNARVNARPLETPNQALPGLLLTVEDITAERRILEDLQLKEYFVHLLFSIVDDLAAWPATDIDEVIVVTLEKIGLATGADRVYLCLFHDRNTHFSITHEWLGDGIASPAPALKGASLRTYAPIFRQVKNRTPVEVPDMAALAPERRAAHDGFHAPGTRSILFAPLVYDRQPKGIIGCDAVRQAATWSDTGRQLLQFTGSTIVNALLRCRLTTARPDAQEDLVQSVDAVGEAPDTGAEPLEYSGPIEVIDEMAPSPAAGKTPADWRFESGEADDPRETLTVLLKKGKTAYFACRQCSNQKRMDIADIRVLGTRLKATCTCGHTMFFKVELRREHRKAVQLEGIFIRGQGDRIAPKSEDWGRIKVLNLSRNGIGFKIFDRQDFRPGDHLRVKFTLDNTARTVVQKAVEVKSVSDAAIGCQFVSSDACDVTIGFYMMT